MFTICVLYMVKAFKFEGREIAYTSVFAALYAVTVISLAPISFGVYQVRIADALLPLSMMFGMPVAVGTCIGCLAANFYGGLGVIDVIGGSIANLVACTVAYHICRNSLTRKRRILGCFIETAIITVIVGGYLSFIFHIPIEIGLINILIGSLVSINMLGYLLLEALLKRGFSPKQRIE